MTNDVVIKYNINIHHQAFSSLKDLCSTLKEMYIVVIFGCTYLDQLYQTKYSTLLIKFKTDSLETSNKTLKQITGILNAISFPGSCTVE